MRVELDAYPGKKWNAIIERIHPRIEWNSRTRIIEARITDKIKLLLRNLTTCNFNLHI